MRFFNFLNRKNGNHYSVENPSTAQARPDIPESLFIERDPAGQRDEKGDTGEKEEQERGIRLLFDFLNVDYQAQGYDDALINPDSNHLAQNLESLKNKLERAIRKVKTYYEDFMEETDFHIQSRSRNGMIDTVEELNMKRKIAESHFKKILEMEEDVKNNRGDSLGIALSYTRGFKNGLAAISHHNILRKKF